MLRLEILLLDAFESFGQLFLQVNLGRQASRVPFRQRTGNAGGDLSTSSGGVIPGNRLVQRVDT